MFDFTSRYYAIEDARYTDADGREIIHKRRRFLPDPHSLQLLVEATVTQGDRLDLIANRTIGDPLQFWRVCDASNGMNPFDLLDPLGRKLRVPVPQP
ncbi:MAG: hypothetical protein SF339_17180 [Blastocatellia bacterium]|nr:hypothetical protein [Blastocatellia bacterium]